MTEPLIQEVPLFRESSPEVIHPAPSKKPVQVKPMADNLGPFMKTCDVGKESQEIITNQEADDSKDEQEVPGVVTEKDSHKDPLSFMKVSETFFFQNNTIFE